MKTEEKNIKKKSMVQKMREIRDKLDLKIKDMTTDELKLYLKNQKT